MKRTLLLLGFAVLVHIPSFAQGNKMESETQNYTSFSSASTKIDDEVLQFNKGYNTHPELGRLFTEAPCEDCFEAIDQRTETSKFFIKKGTNGTYVYQQSSTDAMHIRDLQGNSVTIITQLRPDPSVAGLYTAHQQPIPVGIDANKGYTYLGQPGQRFNFHRDLDLIFVDAGGQEQMLGKASWQNYTAGDNGVYITDAWPGIDIELRVARGQIKSNYIIKNPMPQYASGELRIRDHWNMDDGISVEGKKSGPFHHGIEVKDRNGNVLFVVSPVISFDQQGHDTKINGDLQYEFNGNDVDIIIPNEWVNRTNPAAYPVTIDPLFAGTNSMAIGGSGYNAFCFTGGCSYNLSVPVPAAITITDIRFSFSYITNGFLCFMSDGAMDFQLGACRSPNAAGFYWFCNNPSPGTCNGTNISMLSDVLPCVPTPQCAAYNMNFTMRFYRCYSSGAGCSSTCIGPATPLTITVEGRTVEPTSLVTSLPPVTICQGASTTLTATGQNGVPAYSYTWNPGALPGSPVVSPAATTTYTVTITDQCGNTTTATKVVNVIPSSNPGFTINPNPVCPGQTVTITGLGSSAAANYDWTLPSSANPTVNNTQTFTTTYATAGTYPITLNFANGVCVFPLTQNITVTPAVTPTINITASPSGTICPGTNVTFTANITNGGSSPSYQWQINGVNVGTNSNTFSSATLTNGNVVTCILTSNAPCASPATVTSNSIVMVVIASLVPTINITASPAGAICAGTSVTFTAAITNGGSSPSYQWQVNGVNAGTNSNTFTSASLTNGSTVTCILTSNDPCASPATVTSNVITMVVNPNVVPTINITASPAGPICAGTNVTFTATITNGGSSPSYQWQVNGVNAGTNSNTFSSATLTNGSVVTCILTSNAPCAVPTTVTSNSIVMVVNPVLVPSVTITASPAGPICSGTNVTFTAVPTNGGAAPSYQWQINGVNVGPNASIFSSNTLANGDVITVILTSNALCASPTTATSNTITMTVTPSVVPTVNISALPAGPICAGTSVTFTAVITNGGSSPVYQWQVNGVNAGTNSNTFTSAALANGDVVRVILTSNAPCATPATVNSNTITMVVNPLVTPSVTITASSSMPVCQGANVTFTATPVNGGATPGYQWQVNGVNVGTNSNTYSSATLNAGDVVTVILTTSSPCATVPTAVSNTITITHFPPVTLTMGQNITICQGQTGTLTATAGSGNPTSYTIVWQPGGINASSINVHPNTSTTYTATVTDACGSTATGTVNVTVNPKPIAAFSYSPFPASLDQQPTTFADLSTGAVNWFWSFGDGNTSTTQNPINEYTASGTFNVVLIVSSPDNCLDTAVSQIILEDINSLFIPSAFTPNDDIYNATFNAYGSGIDDFKMEIFNRWGDKIFTTNKMEKGWDGFLTNGTPAPMGVYTYRMEVLFSNNKNEVYIGKVTLLR